MARPFRHHVAPSWELYEPRGGRWVPVRLLKENAERGDTQVSCGEEMIEDGA